MPALGVRDFLSRGMGLGTRKSSSRVAPGFFVDLAYGFSAELRFISVCLELRTLMLVEKKQSFLNEMNLRAERINGCGAWFCRTTGLELVLRGGNVGIECW